MKNGAMQIEKKKIESIINVFELKTHGGYKIDDSIYPKTVENSLVCNISLGFKQLI